MKLHELDISQLSGLIGRKEISVPELTRSVLDRISEIEHKLGSYISIDEERALVRASEVQEKIDKGEIKSPLAGIPMAVKDNICTRDMTTTCASRMLDKFIPPFDATVISKLNENGAILLGKLNMDEFAMGSTSFYSYFKKTKNPWNSINTPEVLCEGTPVSVAAGEAVYALGSDTGGSIRQSASMCGVVGLKPTYGLVSRHGLVACASSFDQIGPVTRNVRDCTLVLNAISGKDHMDSTSTGTSIDDYSKFLGKEIKELRIGIPGEFINNKGLLEEGIGKVFQDAVNTLSGTGIHFEEFSFPLMEYVLPVYCIISYGEISSSMARYDGIKFGYRAESCEDLIDLYKKTRGEGFGPEVKRRVILGTYFLSAKQYEKYYKKALKLRRAITDELEKALEKYDVIIGPVLPVTASTFTEHAGNPAMANEYDAFTCIANLTGLPAMSIPCGRDAMGYPAGLQLFGRRFREDILLKVAYAFEQNLGEVK
ncbi:MAG: Asp-tRNA(Asn)/Glu-tRNA(Gln) amidotransferase subunit GatA [Clostridiaceae bacterium]|nr:Asp-tRNA(Asn)/Glu-tRNA(Gln) amidotransferase subunit GatA [Clostridiaceae bacterium]